jgi:hypothetical protein
MLACAPGAAWFLLLAVPLSAARAQSDSALVAVLQSAHRIRVELADHRAFDGAFRELTPTGFRFRAIVRPNVQEAYFAEMQVPRDSLSRIWVRSGSHWRIGAVIGGVTLGLMGFAAGMTFEGDTDTPGCSGGGCVIGATALFGAVGAVAGGLLGAVFPRWRLVWSP